ncbi:MAG: hypothetical protein Q7J31_02225 [Syntrophales bacterium]|nr:hypothetical protein [Syntrophales bacterium]
MLSRHNGMNAYLQTGQITYHNATGRMIDCTGSGQAGEFRSGVQSALDRKKARISQCGRCEISLRGNDEMLGEIRGINPKTLESRMQRLGIQRSKKNA